MYVRFCDAATLTLLIAIQNVRVIAKYYTRITLARLTILLDLTPQQAEETQAAATAQNNAGHEQGGGQKNGGQGGKVNLYA